MGSAFPWNARSFPAYQTGQREERCWGFYQVTNTGGHNRVEFCEKEICINVRQTLSLQRHYHREETWKILQGSPTIILDKTVMTLSAGQTLEVPAQTIHCIMNFGREPVIFYERQSGVCREMDNQRLSDRAGREVDAHHPNDDTAQKSIEIYKALTNLL